MTNNMEELNNSIKTLEDEQKSLWETMRPIKERLHIIYEELKALMDLKGELQVSEMKEENFIPSPGNWFSEKELELILMGETNSMPLYRHADHLIVSRFNYAFARTGYVPENGQTMFRIALVKGDKERTKLVKDAILYILPHLKWRTKDGYDQDLSPYEKRFDIFEHHLSAGGQSYDLVYTNEDKWLIAERWRKTEYPSLDAALDYIENNLWYERLDKNGKTTSYEEGEEDEY